MENEGEIQAQFQNQNQVVVGEEKIYVAISKDVRESKSILIWALRNSGGRKICLLHVHQPAHMIPLMGGRFPADKLKNEEVTAYRDLERRKMIKIINEYLLICAQVGVQADNVEIEMDNIEKGIIELINRHEIKRLVMGAAADKHYWKKMIVLKSKKAIFVCKHANDVCHISFVCKGFLIHTREAILGGSEVPTTSSQAEYPITITDIAPSENLRLRSLSEGMKDYVKLINPVNDLSRRVKSENYDSQRGRVTSLSSLEGMRTVSALGAEGNPDEWREISQRIPRHLGFPIWSSNELGGASESIPSVRYAKSEDGLILSAVLESEGSPSYPSPDNELVERRITDEMYDQVQQAMSETEDSKREAFEESIRRRKAERYAIDAMRKAKASERLYNNEVKQRKEMEDLLARENVALREMKNQQNHIVEELQTAEGHILVLQKQLNDSDRIIKEMEDKILSAMDLLKTLQRERDELQLEWDNTIREIEELRKRREEDKAISKLPEFFSEFSFLEIEEATKKFDESLIIGEGGFGCVFRGFLHNTEVAIKMLRSNNLQGRSEFQQEMDVLSRLRHPNIVILIGACPEAFSLIYEYLPGGSLEDRLICKDNSPPLSWQVRTRIATDICSALIFLHSQGPHSVVHGDLKPANVLLDANFTTKLGDFGICRFIPRDTSTDGATTPFCITNPKGTLIYMDPEFLSTGELTPKSDTYSFGIILLRLLTGRPAMGIVKEVEYAFERGNLNALLDESAGNWPFIQAKQLAQLALRCCQVNRKDRPDLESEVWGVLEPLKDLYGAPSSSQGGDEGHSAAPSYFICPISQKIMREPCVAADGFTYEGEALKEWLDSGNGTSPMTNLKLTHRNVVPNHSLRLAIQEWQHKQH